MIEAQQSLTIMDRTTRQESEKWQIENCDKMESQDQTVTRIDVEERNREIVQTTYRRIWKQNRIESKNERNWNLKQN